MKDILEIGEKKLTSRFFIGTGKFPSKAVISEVLKASGAQVVTVALRRVDPESQNDNLLKYIPSDRVIMPNTSGARDADEAVRIARLARAVGCGDWIKIEVISDNKYLLPDNLETIKATEILAAEGFVVLPYMTPDLMSARRLVNAGAAAVMPLGSPIGSNRGVKTGELIRILVNEIEVPVIVDAGIGRPSEAAEAMEMGCSAVLVNTAVAVSPDPVITARAFSLAVMAGRMAYLTGEPLTSNVAEASSPLTAFLRGD
jgi:thiazole synthase